jgi:hypothetical protein
MSERWPVDIETLNKGDTIPVERVEVIVGLQRNHPKFRLKALGVIDTIDAGMRRLRGLICTYRFLGGSIFVLTDAQAAVHNARMFDVRMDGAGRALIRKRAVDVRNLPSADVDIHDRGLTILGARWLAQRAVAKNPTLATAQRSTPGLSSYKKP